MIPIIRNFELEKSVIASALSSGKALHELSTKLDESDFSDGYLKKIFVELKKCSSKGYDPDISIMLPKLGDNFTTVFVELMNGGINGGISTSDNITNQCRKLRETSTARNLVSKAYKILCDASTTTDYAEFVAKSVSELADISLDYKSGRLNHVSTYLHEAVDEFSAVQRKVEIGVRTGISDIDNVTAGFRKGEFIVVAGKPAQGKTSLVMSMVKNMVISGKKIGVFSLEMRSSELILKLSSMMSSFYEHEISNAVFRGVSELTKGHTEVFPKTLEMMRDSHLYINESPYTTMTDIEIEVRRFMKKTPLDAIFVDYMSLIADDDGGHSKRHEMIQDYSMRFKRLAKSEKVPIIVLSQIKNDAYNKKPTMADLSESSQLSRDADMIYLLWKPIEDDPKRKVIIGDKGRGVAGGNFCVYFSQNTTEFSSMTKEDAIKFTNEFLPKK